MQNQNRLIKIATKLFLLKLIIILTISCDNPSNQINKLSSPKISREYIKPHNGYSEAVVITSKNKKTIYLSGQIGNGETLEIQMRDALNKLLKLIEECGGSQKDIVKMNSYIVNYKTSDLDTFRKVRKEILGDSEMPASTLIGVQALALPEWKIELDATVEIER